MSNIPVEHIEIAKPSGFFPCDMSVLTIHTELTWNPEVTSLDGTPLQISDDGGVIFYRSVKLYKCNCTELARFYSKSK